MPSTDRRSLTSGAAADADVAVPQVAGVSALAIYADEGTWPGPNNGISVTASEGNWTGNFQPVYWFAGYTNGTEAGQIPLAPHPASG